jgi:hypothetical protein
LIDETRPKAVRVIESVGAAERLPALVEDYGRMISPLTDFPVPKGPSNAAFEALRRALPELTIFHNGEQYARLEQRPVHDW